MINYRYNKPVHEGVPEDMKPMPPFWLQAPVPGYQTPEIWTPIEDWIVKDIWTGMYYVSTYGRVYTAYRGGSIMYLTETTKGYLQARLKTNIMPDGKRKQKSLRVHRLVMIAFCFRPDCEDLEVDHIDGDHKNNHIWNLQWVTPVQNTQAGIQRNEREVDLSLTHGRLISRQEAQQIFLECIDAFERKDEDVILESAMKHNVEPKWIYSMMRGALRPYFKKQWDKNRAFSPFSPYTPDVTI